MLSNWKFWCVKQRCWNWIDGHCSQPSFCILDDSLAHWYMGNITIPRVKLLKRFLTCCQILISCLLVEATWNLILNVCSVSMLPYYFLFIYPNFDVTHAISGLSSLFSKFHSLFSLVASTFLWISAWLAHHFIGCCISLTWLLLLYCGLTLFHGFLFACYYYTLMLEVFVFLIPVMLCSLY